MTKFNNLIITVVFIVMAVAFGYGLYTMSAHGSEATGRESQLATSDDLEPIDTNILSSKNITVITSGQYKAFGQHPVVPNNINRPNPFDGI